MTRDEIQTILAQARAGLLVYDRTGIEHAAWARQHGGKLIDALETALEHMTMSPGARRATDRLLLQRYARPVRLSGLSCRNRLEELRVKALDAVQSGRGMGISPRLVLMWLKEIEDGQ
jgi:hypothetical protein